MKEKEASKLYNSITNVDNQLIEEAQTKIKKKRNGWFKWAVIAACLCLVVVGALELPRLSQQSDDEGGGFFNSGGKWWSDNITIGPTHREDFFPEMSQEAAALFQDVPEVLKVYRTTVDSWFLSDQLTDYSQALTGQVVYIVPNYAEGLNQPPTGEWSYGVYATGEDGCLSLTGGAKLPENTNHTAPHELIGLTDEIILKDLSSIEYDDYIITQSTRLYTVIVWARCSDGNDRFVTYSSRPEFVNLEDHAVYTLEELQQRLANATAGKSSTDYSDSDG